MHDCIYIRSDMSDHMNRAIGGLVFVGKFLGKIYRVKDSLDSLIGIEVIGVRWHKIESQIVKNVINWLVIIFFIRFEKVDSVLCCIYINKQLNYIL